MLRVTQFKKLYTRKMLINFSSTKISFWSLKFSARHNLINPETHKLTPRDLFRCKTHKFTNPREKPRVRMIWCSCSARFDTSDCFDSASFPGCTCPPVCLYYFRSVRRCVKTLVLNQTRRTTQAHDETTHLPLL